MQLQMKQPTKSVLPAYHYRMVLPKPTKRVPPVYFVPQLTINPLTWEEDPNASIWTPGQMGEKSTWKGPDIFSQPDETPLSPKSGLWFPVELFKAFPLCSVSKLQKEFEMYLVKKSAVDSQYWDPMNPFVVMSKSKFDEMEIDVDNVLLICVFARK